MIKAEIDLWEAVKLLTTEDAREFKEIEIDKDMISEAYLLKNSLGYSIHIRLIKSSIDDAKIIYEKIEEISKEDFKNQLFRVL
jgi:hypothetical protein